MTTFRSIVVTPNILGNDGVSCLSRQVVRALPPPTVVLSLHDEHAPEAPGAPVRGAGGHRHRFLREMVRLALQCGPETTVICLHLHLAPAARLLAWRGASVAFILCGIEAWVPLRPAERWALGGGALIAISAHTVARFKAANPTFAGADIGVCHPGLPARAGERPPRAEPLRPTALIVARMSAAEMYKGHDWLIDVWPEILRRHPDVRLCVAGDGDDRARLEARARAGGIAASVDFMGRLSEAALRDAYDACTFFVMPSRDEGFGLVFLEAMRAGKACIGASGAASEVIQDGVTGFLVDPSRPDDLAAAMMRLFDDPAACEALGRAGEARFLSNFTDRHFQQRLSGRITRLAVA